MSTQSQVRRMTATKFASLKGHQKLVCLTAYDAPTAKILDPHVDMLLVGDSLGMVVYGFDSTLPVTLDMMINHGGAVMRGSQKALVIVDMPFGSYQESPQQAFRNAARVIAETGCGGVKLEGGVEMAETVHFLTQNGIPVMGHIGLTPQSIHTLGSYRARGRNLAERRKILADAKAIFKAGAFSIVVEAVQEAIARRIATYKYMAGTPIIGIGGSPACDGQILVTQDMVGLSGREVLPAFVKKYADLGVGLSEVAARYASEVREGKFPTSEHCYFPKPKPKAAQLKR